jgi:threonine/homoserine/homoserine lactone efflux protein
MLGIQHFSAFLLACVALNLTPGLDTFYILARSTREGRAAGIAAALGINAGCLVHTTAAVLGLSALLMASAYAFSILKYLGAAYLCWIGLGMLRSRSVLPATTVTKGRGFRAALVQGLLTNVLNPKVALFYLAFLPPFISMHASHPRLALLALGITFIGTGLCWSMVLAVLGARFQGALRARPAVGTWTNRICGTVLCAFGVGLALQRTQ